MAYGKLTKADIKKQGREQMACAYLTQQGIWGVRYVIKGDTLIFKYNFVTAEGMKTMERHVNLITLMFKDKCVKNNEQTGIVLNMCTGQFMRAY